MAAAGAEDIQPSNPPQAAHQDGNNSMHGVQAAQAQPAGQPFQPLGASHSGVPGMFPQTGMTSNMSNMLHGFQGFPGQSGSQSIPQPGAGPYSQANLLSMGHLSPGMHPSFPNFLGMPGPAFPPGMAPSVPDGPPGALPGLQQYFGGFGPYSAYATNPLAQAQAQQSLSRFGIGAPQPPMMGMPPHASPVPTQSLSQPSSSAPSHPAPQPLPQTAAQPVEAHAAAARGGHLAMPQPSGSNATSGHRSAGNSATATGLDKSKQAPPAPPAAPAAPTPGADGTQMLTPPSEASAVPTTGADGNHMTAVPQIPWGIASMQSTPSNQTSSTGWTMAPAMVPAGAQPQLGSGYGAPALPAGAAMHPALQQGPMPPTISSLASLLGGFVPASSGAMPVSGAAAAPPPPQACQQLNGVTPVHALPSRSADGQAHNASGNKRARTTPLAPPDAVPQAAAAEEENDGNDAKQEDIVEKRLKQNREAARRSRERKRHLKEELRRRMPLLQKQHDDMAREVDDLMKGTWSNVSKLLSKEMQALMQQQTVYLQACAGLATHLSSTDNDALAVALERVDGCWTQLLATVDSIKGGFGLFMLFNSMHAPPSHWVWFLLGGIKVSYVVRAFLELSTHVPIVAASTHASLARSVEGWAFHEAILEQGKVLLRSKLREACVALARQQRDTHSSAIPPALLGHLDTLSVLLANDMSLRKQIIAALRKTLTPRQMCLLLVVQTELLESHVPRPQQA